MRKAESIHGNDPGTKQATNPPDSLPVGCAVAPAAAQTVAAILPPITAPSIGAWYEIHNVSGNGYPGAEAVCRARTPTLPVRFIAYNAPNDPYSGITGTCQAETMPGFWSDTAYPAYYQHCPAGYGVPPELSVTFSYPNAGPLTCNRIGAFNRCPDAQAGEAPYTLDSSGLTCSRPDPETYTLTLTPASTTIEPGQSTRFTVTVENQLDHQPPKNPVNVNISLKVDSTSGGHAHGDSTRPRGSIDKQSCNSDATCKTFSIGGSGTNGMVSFSFGAPAASGTHTIMATCDGCSNTETKSVNVKIDKLEEIPVTMAWVLLKKPGATHPHGHYLNGDALLKLRLLAGYYNLNFTGNPALHLNDASLVWGGLFDVHGDWQTGYHSKHRLGKVIDIRANAAEGAIPARNFEAFRKYIAKLKLGINVQTPHCSAGRSFVIDQCIGDEGRHFHVLLLNEEG